jgi:voltage-gated potassium channel
VPQVRSELLLWVFKFGRILRVFKLLKFIDEAKVLAQALRGSARTICVFLFFVFLLQVVLGYAIFVIESSGPNSQFETVSKGVYWAIVTMTTVGYGDVVPQTALGRLLASVVMMLGFGIIAIPTGILTVSGVQHHQKQLEESACHQCGRQGHRRDAQHCDQCGTSLGESIAGSKS